jgi:hypothetical protein
MMKKIRTSALLFIMLALLIAPLSLGSAATADNGIEARDDYGNLVDDVQPVDVEELEGSGIMAIGAELDPDDGLAPQARINGEVVPFETLIYKVMNTNNHLIVIVGGTLPEGTPLPATIEVAVPAGSPVFWFGEVGASGDPAQDPAFPDDRRSVRTEGDLDVYTAVMTTYLDMQIEYRLNHNPFSQGSDGPMVSLEYTPWQDVSELSLAAALPPGSAVLASDVEFLGFGPGETAEERSAAFARVFTDARAGELYSTEITYTITSPGAATSNLDPAIVIGLVAVLVIAAGTLFFLFAKTKKPQDDDEDAWGNQRDDEDEDDTEDEGDESEDEDLVCARCDTEIEPDSKFCRNCGSGLTA